MKMIGRKCRWGADRYSNGNFLGFGIDYQHDGEQIGHFSVALVERKSDGQILSFPVSQVQFVSDKHQQPNALDSMF